MKLASFDALVSALQQAADRPQDRIDIEYLRKRLEDGGGI